VTSEKSTAAIKPLARWTIGITNRHGYDCLVDSILSFTDLYDVDIALCHNCPVEQLPHLPGVTRIDQRELVNPDWPKPVGVSWKLYPTRLEPLRHEIVIDNDIVFNKRIPEIDQFFTSDCTLILGAAGRTYGRFEKHVPPGLCLNSGIYGLPPNFNLDAFVTLYAGKEWEQNAHGEHAENVTFDEQGIVAFALSTYKRCVIIPATSVTDCEDRLVPGDGHHFIGLNRRRFHRPFMLHKLRHHKFYL
jgi:hypothetical protein